MRKRINPSGATSETISKICIRPSDKNKVVFKAKDCENGKAGECNECQVSCLFDAIARDKTGKIVIKAKLCSGCGRCVEACAYDCLVDKKEFVPLVDLLRNKTTPVFAIVAPAFVGQFGNDVTPAKLRTALKMLGFYGMVEVALFADILTLKELSKLGYPCSQRSKNLFGLAAAAHMGSHGSKKYIIGLSHSFLLLITGWWLAGEP